MRSFLTSILLVLLAGCASAPSAGSDEDIVATAAQIEAGRAMAAEHCGSCHAVGAADQSMASGAIPFRRLSELYPVSSLAEAFAEGIVTGHPAMPEWVLEPDEITSLLGYIESIQVRKN